MKLRLRKNDFDRVHSLEQKKEMASHRERTEALYRQKLEEERRKIMKGRLDEMEEMINENKRLREEI